jgi:N-formylglutamate amidohydrolase
MPPNPTTAPERIWKIERDAESGSTPIIAAAIHDGHAMRAEIENQTALAADERKREEDPFTAVFASAAPTRIIGTRSRFEVDLNRPREKAVYQKPDDAWGLEVWKEKLSPEDVEKSLAEYDAFYAAVHKLLSEFENRFGKFVVFDLHSYNHRRDGKNAPAADENENPEINIGTGSLDRARWAPVIDTLIAELSSREYSGRQLDVRENVKFQGGEFGKWIHRNFPDSACAPAIEWKKFWMDEWSGNAPRENIESLQSTLAAAVPGVLRALENIKP